MLQKYSLQNRNPSHTFNQLYEPYTSFLALPFLQPFFAMSGLKHLSPLAKTCAYPCPISPLSCHLKKPVCQSICHTHLPSHPQFLPWCSLSCLALNTLLLLFDFGSTVFILHVLLKGFSTLSGDFPPPHKKILSNFFINLALEWHLLGTTSPWFVCLYNN